MKKIKRLELISGFELAFGSYLTWAINMKNKGKEAIIRLKKQTENQSEKKHLYECPNQQFGRFVKRKKALVSSTISKVLRSLRRHLKWIITEIFPW